MSRPLLIPFRYLTASLTESRIVDTIREDELVTARVLSISPSLPIGGPEAFNGFDSPSKWDLLWHTFWGKLAPECFVKCSARIPDPRTLETPIEDTNYEYLKLPNDDVFFPCNLDRILITETYESIYKLLCEQDKLYAELPKSNRLRFLKHSTIITGQPGTGERLTAFVISVVLNKWDNVLGKSVSLSCILVWRLWEKKPTVYCKDKTCAYVFTSMGVKGGVSVKRKTHRT